MCEDSFTIVLLYSVSCSSLLLFVPLLRVAAASCFACVVTLLIVVGALPTPPLLSSCVSLLYTVLCAFFEYTRDIMPTWKERESGARFKRTCFVVSSFPPLLP